MKLQTLTKWSSSETYLYIDLYEMYTGKDNFEGRFNKKELKQIELDLQKIVNEIHDFRIKIDD